LGLAKHFERVIATDRSSEQIRHATPHPRIEYRVADSERSGLEDRSMDLVTVAAAIHWLDLDGFYREARRVLRPGGVLAAWTYHVGHVEPPFDQVFGRFYDEILRPYFEPGVRHVDERYETITLPGEALASGEWSISASWDLDRMLVFIESWSGTQQYIKERSEDPVALIAEELERLWGERKRRHEIRWPLYVRISRL
jgi:SAM-dependent methyltransferase